MSYDHSNHETGGFDDLLSARPSSLIQPSFTPSPYDEDNPFADVISPLRQHTTGVLINNEQFDSSRDIVNKFEPSSDQFESLSRGFENANIHQEPSSPNLEKPFQSHLESPKYQPLTLNAKIINDSKTSSPKESPTRSDRGHEQQLPGLEERLEQTQLQQPHPTFNTNVETATQSTLDESLMQKHSASESMDQVSLKSGGTAGEASAAAVEDQFSNSIHEHSKTASISSQSNYASSLKVPETGVRPTFKVSVIDPQKIGDSISGHIVYSVKTSTTSNAFRKKEMQVLRRYRDFLWLYNALSHGNPGVIVPPTPEKHAIGRFADDFIENRRIALETMLNKICAHPMLYGDPDLQLFLESDTFGIQIKSRKDEVSSKGLMRTLGESINAPKFVEQDDWFNEKKYMLDSLESQLKALYKSLDAISRQRREIGMSSAEFGETMLTLATIESNKPLAIALRALGNIAKRIRDMQEKQSKQDVLTLFNTTDEYLRLIGSIRDSFNSRVKTYVTWQQLEKDLKFLKKNYERQKVGGRTHQERLSQMLHEIAEGERRVSDSRQDFDDVSKLIKAELDRFDKEKVEDFKLSLERFVENLIHDQGEIVKLWENYAKELDIVEASLNLHSAEQNIIPV